MSPQCFTLRADGRLKALVTSCGIAPGFDPTSEAALDGKSYQAIWDTGATNSVISEKIARELGLQPVTFALVRGATGTAKKPVYLVNVVLPNHVGFPQVRVTEAADLAGCDVLIGMDIITAGDFAVTNVGGKTVFSFRCPSAEAIDFCAPGVVRAYPKVSRNEKCPCGSGKKYKQCHGA